MVLITATSILPGSKAFVSRLRALCPQAVSYTHLECKISVPPCDSLGTIVYLAVDGVYWGQIVIADEVKPDAADAICLLKNAGIQKTVMLTGDSRAVGEAVARQLGLDEVHAQLLPADKVEIVERLLTEKAPNKKLAFIGDGVNDAPVLSRADIGLSLIHI